MVKYIKRKKYDTSTAVKVALVNFETLYHKRNDEFFLEKDSCIIPLTKDQARSWAVENNISADVYEKFFTDTFANRFRSLRRKVGLTQKELADITEIPKRTIEDWERGFRLPPAYVQKLVIEKLETL